MYTSKGRYIPRHAAETWAGCAARRAAGICKAARESAQTALKRAKARARKINAAMDEEMTGPELVLCGVVMGVLAWPVTLFLLSVMKGWAMTELGIAAVIAGIILLICTEDETLEQFARRQAKRKERKKGGRKCQR